MSSSETTTRSRILQAALRLIESGAKTITMSAIADEAGLSRQALYLAFSDKSDLFIALLRFADGRRGIVQEQARIRAAESGIAALLAIIDLQARLSPAYKPLADAFDVLRRQDPAAQNAWQDRQNDRLEGCRAVAARIAAEGKLRLGLDTSTAADLIWTTTSSTTWDDLVVKRGWTAAEYQKRLAELLLSLLVT
ncbi:TetR/AcrR family transcriptional regulator [Methylosinus sp. R-45379]|uniref:TetR/AcrR family transcriptional regulator n=1 Tax=Methylosinus sp. R-45379 TaxID=980563 RepID=UPI000A053770|nr:TetR/AcrR family transcriptional regulator [Methylosinus sp. R-45379]